MYEDTAQSRHVIKTFGVKPGQGKKSIKPDQVYQHDSKMLACFVRQFSSITTPEKFEKIQHERKVFLLDEAQ